MLSKIPTRLLTIQRHQTIMILKNKLTSRNFPTFWYLYGHPEAPNLHRCRVFCGGQQHAVRFQIPVDYTVGMAIAQGFQNLSHIVAEKTPTKKVQNFFIFLLCQLKHINMKNISFETKEGSGVKVISSTILMSSENVLPKEHWVKVMQSLVLLSRSFFTKRTLGQGHTIHQFAV